VAVLGGMLIVWRFVAMVSWLGGPLYLFDLLKNGDDDLPVAAICTAPIALMMVGSFGFNASRIGRTLVRFGMFGSVSMLLLDCFATACFVFYWSGDRDEHIIIAGLAAGFIAAGSYLALARTYLSRPSPL
jgi:hypothetical protein